MKKLRILAVAAIMIGSSQVWAAKKSAVKAMKKHNCRNQVDYNLTAKKGKAKATTAALVDRYAPNKTIN